MSLDLKHGIPTKVRGTARRNNAPKSLALKEDGLGTRSLTVCKRADSRGTLIVKARQQTIESCHKNTSRTIQAQLLQKVLDVGTGETIECVERQRCILCETGTL